MHKRASENLEEARREEGEKERREEVRREKVGNNTPRLIRGP